MENLIEVVRVEKKYDLSEVAALKLREMLSVGLREDPNNGWSGYRVRSLYFDSIYDDDYADKIEGLENRKKIRLRIYDLNSSIVKLELKQKYGQNQCKQTIIISREIAQKMIEGRYEGLLSSNHQLAQELYYTMQQGLYRPKCIVEYNRYAYIGQENNTRVTLDENIRFSEACYDLFAEDLMLSPVGNQTILEVKYNHFLTNHVKDFLHMVDKKETAFSKYIMARQVSYI